MKKLVFLALCLFGVTLTNSYAQGIIRYTNACQRADFSFDSYMQTCLNQNKSKLFAEVSVDFCKNFSFDSEKNNCMTEIANKGYYPEDLTLCSNQSFDSGKINCLRGLESYLLVEINNTMSVAEFKRLVRARVVEIKTYVDSGNLFKALRSIALLLELLAE